MLDIYTSRYNRILEEELFAEAIRAYEGGQQVYILVPEQYTLQNELLLMQKIKSKAASRIRIMSFQKLALESLSKIGGLKRTYIDSLGKSMVLKNILFSSNLSIYSDSADKEGFVQSVLNQIAELKRSRITPDMLETLAEKTQDHSLLSQKLQELVYLYREMELALGNKYVDNEDRLGQLAEIRDLSHLQDVKVYLFGFLGFTAVELEIIGNLLGSGVELAIGLCLDEKTTRSQDETIFLATLKSKEQLESIAHAHQIQSRAREITKEDEAQGGNLRLLENNLFKTIPKSFDREVSDIRIFASHSLDEEVHNIAREITKKVVNEGYQYKDFMVVSAQPEAYNPAIKQIFSQYRIPTFLDEKRPIINSPIIKTIIAILNLLGDEFRLEDMMVLLKNGFFDVGKEKAMIFENFMLRRRFRGRMFFEDKYFVPKKELNESQKAELEMVLEVRRTLREVFEEPLAEIGQGQTSALQLAEILMGILDQIAMFQNIQALLEELRKNNLLDEANENNQIWNIVVKILEQAVEIFGEEGMTVQRFKELFVEAARGHQLAVIPPALDQVVAGDMERSRSNSKKAIYLCGANSGNIPKPYRESAILTQEEKQRLYEKGLDLPSKKDNVLLNDLLTLYIMLTRAENQLMLSYSSEGGKLPAMLLGQIRDIFPKIPVETVRDLKARDLITLPRPTIDAMSRQLKQFQKGQAVDDWWLKALDYYTGNPETREMASMAVRGLEYSNAKENLKNAKKLYHNHLKLSTTRLTSLVQCPFKHFVRYGLGARERKEYAIESTELGIVLHDTMEHFIQKLAEDSALVATLTKAQADQLIDGFFDQAMQKMLKEHDINDNRNKFLLERQRKAARHIGYISVEEIRNEGFALYKQEARFGYDGEREVGFALEGEEVQLVGTIDRIDLLQEEGKVYVKIIDYKTRNKKFDLSDAYNGVDIQLLLYLYAAISAIEMPDATVLPAGAFYFPVIHPIITTAEREAETIEKARQEEIKADGILIDDADILRKLGKDPDKKNKNVFSKSEIEAFVAHIMEGVQDSVRQMLLGNIQAWPTSQNNGQTTACDYCRYKAICHFEPALGDEYRYLFKYDEEQIKAKLKKDYPKSEKEEASGKSVDTGTKGSHHTEE